MYFHSNSYIKIIVFVFALCGSFTVLAEAVNFITCPVYRDTDAGPKSGCWLATDRASGIRYDIGSGLTKPLGEQAVLVEGRTNKNSKTDSQLCGGVVLNPVRVSVLEQKCSAHMLPAENYPGRVFRPPGELMQPLSVERKLPRSPFDNRSYSILFNYNSDFLNYQYSEVILEKASLYIRASKAKVTVIGYAATSPISVSNQQIQESVLLAEVRAKKVETALLRLGVNPDKIKIESSGKPSPVTHYADGLEQETLRRVDIVLSEANP